MKLTIDELQKTVTLNRESADINHEQHLSMIQKRPTGDQVSSLCKKSVKDLEEILRKQIKGQVEFLDEKIGGIEAGLKEELKYLREVDQETENKLKQTNADIERNRNQISRLREDLESRPAPTKADINLGDI
jgi:septal ring factor EnvC (AmiA/AmiB activator)